MRFAAVLSLIVFSATACPAAPPVDMAHTVVLRVNGEPVTARDIIERTLYRNLTGPPQRANAFIGRVDAMLEGDKIKELFRQKLEAAQPHTPAETVKVTERIKKELVEDAMWLVLSEDAAAKGAAMEALIGDRLKLQAAKRFGIDITDEQVEKSIIADRLAAGEIYGVKLDLSAYYARREEYGIRRKTIREIKRAELAWRAVINRIYGAATGWDTSGGYESFSRAYLGKVRQRAVVEHRD